MTPRQKRMTLVFGIIAGVSVAGALALNAFRQNVTFFFDPTQVTSGEVPAGERFRLGGMVTKGSVQRAPGSLEVRFVVTRSVPGGPGSGRTREDDRYDVRGRRSAREAR
jgi:cytochrome c-type biogenesis protein CcmE